MASLDITTPDCARGEGKTAWRTGLALTALLAAGLWLGDTFEAAAEGPPLPERKNALYGEIGGVGLMTINYERALSKNLSLRVGGGAVPLIGYDIVLIPSLVLGSGRHRFSAGVGPVAVWYADGTPQEVLPGVEIAYRFQKNPGLFFRASLAYVAVQDWDQESVLRVVPGASVGWSF